MDKRATMKYLRDSSAPDAWRRPMNGGYSKFNALFCTRSDPSHKKPDPIVLWNTAVEYLEITPEIIQVQKPHDPCLQLHPLR